MQRNQITMPYRELAHKQVKTAREYHGNGTSSLSLINTATGRINSGSSLNQSSTLFGSRNQAPTATQTPISTPKGDNKQRKPMEIQNKSGSGSTSCLIM